MRVMTLKLTTVGSAFSLIVTPAVVCGTKTVQRPCSTPQRVIVACTWAVMSTKQAWEGVRTWNCSNTVASVQIGEHAARLRDVVVHLIDQGLHAGKPQLGSQPPDKGEL